MTKRAINFNAGPAAIPLPALERAQKELLDFDGTGMSVMEHSHRGKNYEAVHGEAKSLLKSLLAISDDYEILFLQGGASQQFAMVPMNLLGSGTADHVVTGAWGEKALEEAKIVGNVRIAMTTKGEDGSYVRVPRADELKVDPAAAYVHLTSNETIHGVQFHAFPDTGSVPLVCDMSSDILWKPIDVSKFGVIYAGAQKNLGPSGVVVVIIRKDLVARSPKTIPAIFRYSTHAKNDSLYNTAPTFGIYMLRNVLAWVASEGGAAGMEARNTRKAAMLYGAIDENAGFFRCPVEKGSRSTMNVVFRLPSEALEEKFVSEAKKAEGIVGIKGHRSVGGIRISMYNAVDPGSVETLVGFMREFAKTNG